MIWKFANESRLLTLQIPYYLSFENLLNHQYEQLLMALYFWCDTLRNSKNDNPPVSYKLENGKYYGKSRYTGILHKLKCNTTRTAKWNK